jgi:hypothetical protein
LPLLDHFHPPLSLHRPWTGIHCAWANCIAQQLNAGLLPDRYFAMPQVQLGGNVQIDVATMEDAAARSETEPGGIAVWAPPRPALTVPVAYDRADIFEVRIVNNEEGLDPVAAIELVSPANKDRPSHRRAFAVKCAAYLQAGVSVIVVDIVTRRAGSLHDELMDILKAEPGTGALSALYAAAYRNALAAEQPVLEIWPEVLAVGQPLPTLPLWLDDLALPLDLEESYESMCRTLRIAT